MGIRRRGKSCPLLSTQDEPRDREVSERGITDGDYKLLIIDEAQNVEGVRLAYLGIYLATNTDNRICCGPVLENVLHNNPCSEGYAVSVVKVGELERDYIAHRDRTCANAQVAMGIAERAAEDGGSVPSRASATTTLSISSRSIRCYRTVTAFATSTWSTFSPRAVSSRYPCESRASVFLGMRRRR